jgi:hypothetical protein
MAGVVRSDDTAFHGLSRGSMPKDIQYRCVRGHTIRSGRSAERRNRFLENETDVQPVPEGRIASNCVGINAE